MPRLDAKPATKIHNPGDVVDPNDRTSGSLNGTANAIVSVPPSSSQVCLDKALRQRTSTDTSKQRRGHRTDGHMEKDSKGYGMKEMRAVSRAEPQPTPCATIHSAQGHRATEQYYSPFKRWKNQTRQEEPWNSVVHFAEENKK